MNKKTPWIARSKQAEAAIARHGISAWLLFLCALLMSFLSIYTLTLGGVAGSLARNWEATLTQSGTLRILPSSSTPENAASIAENILDTTPGISGYYELTADKQLALLAPWLGEAIPADLLALPKIYATTVDTEVLDEESLVLRVKAELPSAIWDNHQRWRGPLLNSAKRLRILSILSTVIIGFAFIFLIFVSAEASMFSNSNAIALLRQVGAKDGWIADGFLRKFVTRILTGSLAGVTLGLIATYGLLSKSAESSSMFGELSITSIQWPRAFLVVLAAGIFGYLSTRYATYRYLKKVS